MFYRFVRSSGPSPLDHPMEVCTARACAAHAQGAVPGCPPAPVCCARRAAASRRRTPPPWCGDTEIHSTCAPHARFGPAPQWRCVPYAYSLQPTTALYLHALPVPSTQVAVCGPRTHPPPTHTLPLFYRPHTLSPICGHRTMKTPYPVRSAKLSMVSSS